MSNSTRLGLAFDSVCAGGMAKNFFVGWAAGPKSLFQATEEAAGSRCYLPIKKVTGMKAVS